MTFGYSRGGADGAENAPRLMPRAFSQPVAGFRTIERRSVVVRELQNRFVEGPILLVPSGGGATFNAVGATPIPGVGTVYFSRYRTKGEWGTLEATNGVLISDDGRRRLPGPVRIEGANVTGDGWTVTVAPGWNVSSGPRSGDYQIIRAPR